MLLDNSSDSPSTSTPDGAGSGKPGGPAVMIVVILLLVVGGVIVWRHSPSAGPGGNTPNGTPTIVQTSGSPPPTIFAARAGTPIPPVAKEWAVCANSSAEYWFEYPTAWTLSIPPEYTPPGAARMLQAPKQRSVAMVIIPFGLYGSTVKDEIAKAEFTYLGNHDVDGAETKSQVNGHDALRRKYKCKVETAAGFENWNAVATMVTSTDKGYAIFLRGDDTEIAEAMPTYEKVVSSFHIEKLPLRASGVPAPGPSGGASGAPTTSGPSAAPSGDKGPSPAADGKGPASPAADAKGPAPASPAADAKAPASPAADAKGPAPASPAADAKGPAPATPAADAKAPASPGGPAASPKASK